MNFWSQAIVALAASQLFCSAYANAATDRILELDRLPPQSSERMLRIWNLSDEAGTDVVADALDAFREGSIHQSTLLDVLKYHGTDSDPNLIQEVLDVAWENGAQSGDLRPYFQTALYYGDRVEVERVIDGLSRDFDVFGIQAVLASGDRNDIEEVKRLAQKLEASGDVDASALRLLSEQGDTTSDGLRRPLERRQRQALLRMGEGERNIFFAYEICAAQPIGWESLRRSIETYGSESALRLLSRDVLPGELVESFADLIVDLFPSDELVARFSEASLNSASLSSAARSVVEPIREPESIEQQNSRSADAADEEGQSSITALWLYVFVAVALVGIVVILVRSRKGKSGR